MQAEHRGRRAPIARTADGSPSDRLFLGPARVNRESVSVRRDRRGAVRVSMPRRDAVAATARSRDLPNLTSLLFVRSRSIAPPACFPPS